MTVIFLLQTVATTVPDNDDAVNKVEEDQHKQAANTQGYN